MNATTASSTTAIPLPALEARAEALGNMRNEDINDAQVWALLLADAQAEWDDQPLRCTAYPEFCGCSQS